MFPIDTVNVPRAAGRGGRTSYRAASLYSISRPHSGGTTLRAARTTGERQGIVQILNRGRERAANRAIAEETAERFR